MKCISGCVFLGLGRSSCRISIQLVQTRILKAFFSLLAECSSLPKVVYVWWSSSLCWLPWALLTSTRQKKQTRAAGRLR